MRITRAVKEQLRDLQSRSPIYTGRSEIKDLNRHYRKLIARGYLRAWVDRRHRKVMVETTAKVQELGPPPPAAE